MTNAYVNYLKDEILVEIQVQVKKRIQASFEVFKDQSELETFKANNKHMNFIDVE
ncbi:hypothetical protein [Priestia aryabhattai]|uniref:hypothetical protein n=1 Tax=Priestia aryabhattai TaxID=412384 RepID=UPI002E1EBE19|nr:hypothetical protein [Priestia aryabhattai]